MRGLLQALTILCLAAAPLQGAAEGHSVGPMVGQVWPSGEIGHDMDGAVAPGLFYEYEASEVFSVYGNVFKSNHTNDKLKLLSTAAGIKATIIYIDKLAPYAFFGMGLYFVDKYIPRTAETASKTLFGFNTGLGADLDLNDQFFVGMTFHLHNLFSGAVELPRNGRTELSGRWTGFFLRGGIRF